MGALIRERTRPHRKVPSIHSALFVGRGRQNVLMMLLSERGCQSDPGKIWGVTLRSRLSHRGDVVVRQWCAEPDKVSVTIRREVKPPTDVFLRLQVRNGNGIRPNRLAYAPFQTSSSCPLHDAWPVPVPVSILRSISEAMLHFNVSDEVQDFCARGSEVLCFFKDLLSRRHRLPPAPHVVGALWSEGHPDTSIRHSPTPVSGLV